MFAVRIIYNAATAATNAPIAPATEPESKLPAFVEAVSGAVVVPVEEPVGLAVVFRPPVVPLTPDPELPVAVAEVGATPVPDALPMPLPAPSEGESPPPDEARTDPVATDATDDVELDFEPAALELSLELPLELPVEPPVELEVEVGALLELLEETAEQERSKYGVVLKGFPLVTPKLGLV